MIKNILDLSEPIENQDMTQQLEKLIGVVNPLLATIEDFSDDVT